MKIIRVKNELVSLENVRKVTLHTDTSKHTCKGIPYTTNHYAIWVLYLDDKSERIDCGEDAMGEAKAEYYFEKILNILSEKA